MTNKKTDLQFLLCNSNLKPDIIVITEVNPKVCAKYIQDSEFNISGYNMFSANVGKDRSRGILIYVDKRYLAIELDIESLFSEYLFVQINMANKRHLTIGAFYRSPSSSKENDEGMHDLICNMNKKCPNSLLLIRDFNYPGINWKNWTSTGGSHLESAGNKFISCLQNNLLLQHVSFPTRARGSQAPSTLDLILTNNDFVTEVSNVSPLGKSDHSVVHCVCNLSLEVELTEKFNYNKGRYDDLRAYVSGAIKNDNVQYGDVNTVWNYFKTVLDSACRSFIPTVVNNSWKKKNSWQIPICKESVKLIKKKHRLWTRFQETKDLNIELRYKKIRNLVRKETRNLNNRTQYDIAKSCKKNPKKFWQHVNSKTRTHKTIGNIREIDSMGKVKIIDNDLDKANAFAEYFVKVYSNDLSHDFVKLKEIMPPNSMPPLTFTAMAVQKKLNALNTNKSPGPDFIHPKVLHELHDTISIVLSKIFELFLGRGEVPEDWKCSNVTVIYKKGRKDSVENYRPISLTCVACKVMESIIRDYIMEYFISNKLFTISQYGFIKVRSTMIQLMKELDDWTSCIDTGGQIDIVYTDFEKAFDKVSHKGLISKLYSYGISDSLISWIASFLCHRTQRVKINKCFSDSRPVLSGIPQGSVLGPLLFVIFINDLPDVCEKLCNVFLFADDAKIYKHIRQKEDYLCLKEGCQRVFDWSKQWNMSLNIAKCKVLTVVRHKKIAQKFDYGFSINMHLSVPLEHVVDMKDLGVLFDSDLSFCTHIHEKIKKAYHMLGIINRNFKNIDKSTFLLLYNSLVRSILEFSNSVWNPYKKYLIAAIERVQKRATKMIGSCKKMPYSERLRYLDLPTLKFRRIRGDMIEVFKILNGIYDTHIVPTLLLNQDTRTRGNSLKLMHTRSKYDVRKYSFCSRVVGIWNTLPDYVVRSCSVNVFKNNIDKYWLNEDLRYNYEATMVGCII